MLTALDLEAIRRKPDLLGPEKTANLLQRGRMLMSGLGAKGTAKGIQKGVGGAAPTGAASTIPEYSNVQQAIARHKSYEAAGRIGEAPGVGPYRPPGATPTPPAAGAAAGAAPAAPELPGLVNKLNPALEGNMGRLAGAAEARGIDPRTTAGVKQMWRDLQGGGAAVQQADAAAMRQLLQDAMASEALVAAKAPESLVGMMRARQAVYLPQPAAAPAAPAALNFPTPAAAAGASPAVAAPAAAAGAAPGAIPGAGMLERARGFAAANPALAYGVGGGGALAALYKAFGD